jgi:hypothetical protein
MHTGLIVAVSDGSYSNFYGTAAWVLQGTSSRCTGQVICPGSAADQNSYKSEVSGLLSILTMVDQFVKFFNIDQGSLEVACDGESALNQIFSYVPITNINEPCFDLLFIDRQLWQNSPLKWITRHVKGHQDANSPEQALDIYSKLNIEMDATAKSFMSSVLTWPRHFYTINEPWSLWVDQCKVTSDLGTLSMTWCIHQWLGSTGPISIKWMRRLSEM